MKLKDFVSKIESWLSSAAAESWDNAGLLLGDWQQEISKVVVALDVDESAVSQAVATEANLILAHHPLIFSPLKSLTSKDPLWERIVKLIKHNIGVYAAHTSLDKAKGGVSDCLAELLNLTDVEVLQPEENLYKLVVFVPEVNLEEVKMAVGAAGAGVIGRYQYCSFYSSGKGSFLPLAGAKPAIGQVGQLEEVAEQRLEVLVGQEKLNQVIQAMLDAHPYEEVAYDLYPLAGANRQFGLGRMGFLPEPLTEAAFIDYCQQKLKVKVKVAGEKGLIKRVAVCGGSGGKLIEQAFKAQADAYVSGDFNYHQAQLAQSYQLLLVDAGHQATEAPAVKALARWVKTNLPELNLVEIEPAPVWRLW